MDSGAGPFFSASDVEVRYGPLVALSGGHLAVDNPGDVVCILGPNGAGKSTLVNAIVGTRPLTSGSIVLDGTPLHGSSTSRRVAAGITLVPERRRLFDGMTIAENLLLGGCTLERKERASRFQEVLQLFPLLKDRLSQIATSCSGGEQQMVALARGLMSKPRLLILDEPFLGLSPIARDKTVEYVEMLSRDHAISVVFIEQQVKLSLQVSDSAYVLQGGRVVAHGPAGDFTTDEVRRLFLGS